MKKRRSAVPYSPRIKPAISTSSKVFIDKKTKSRNRRALKADTAKKIDEETGS